MLSTIPVGALLVTACAVLAVAPLRRPRSAAMAGWLAGMFPNELPFAFALLVVGPNALALADGEVTAADRVTAALTVVVIAALAVVVTRAGRTRASVASALDDALGPVAASHLRSSAASRLRRWGRILVLPYPVRPRSVVRIRGVPYGERRREQVLDVYRHRSLPLDAPTLIHLHGGHFRRGRRSREARALLFRLAERGWTCISADYHLSRTPAEGFPTHLVDVKRLLAWARAEGRTHGVDPRTIVLSGSSAGAHLTAMASLTAGDPRFQPGFEDADTSVTAAIGLGGYYGGLDGDDAAPSSPLAHEGPAPPFLVVHGDRDTVTPPDGARRLVAHLRAQRSDPVVHVELPGGQHAFDLFSTVRFEAVVDGIEAFTTWVRADPDRRR